MKKIILLIITLSLTSCAIFTDEYQANQRKVLAYLLSDLPLPKDADIIKEPTVVLGTGKAISGRVVLESSFTPAENLIFYGNETPSTGWILASSEVGEDISLIYTKDGRYANIHITPKTGIGSFFSGSYGSDIIISVVHPEAIDLQNPYEDLRYENLPEIP
ncbi:hypothetical protein OAS63_02130 [Gammaproteobacteria bacterium]|nr:hypothetical protein [Gammaproteobacteria bacterium]|tara:strand:- start:227 stop:709 length:483 start_codon:yes stop_codon:yes gene_type:complete